jgi:hypothetical protein
MYACFAILSDLDALGCLSCCSGLDAARCSRLLTATAIIVRVKHPTVLDGEVNENFLALLTLSFSAGRLQAVLSGS